MNNPCPDIAARRAAQETPAATPAGDTQYEKLLVRIRRLLERDKPDLRAIMTQVALMRGGFDAATAARLDEFLLGQLLESRHARRELEAVHGDLRSELERLLQPPYYPARYLGPAAWQGDNFAEIACDGGHRVVAIGQDVPAHELRAGDAVYLNHARNAVIARSPDSLSAGGETVTFSRFTADGRLIVSDHDAEIVAFTASDLETGGLRAGDLLLWDRGARMVLSRVDTRDDHGFEEIDAAEAHRLAGIDEIRNGVLARFAARITHPELAERYGLGDDAERRLLLHGPPGTGKTTLMRVVASELARASGEKCRVVKVSGASLHSAYVGETERNIRRCFAALKSHSGPAIAFFDEIDAIGRTRGNPAGYHDDRFLGTLLAEMEGIQRNDVAVIAATNRCDTLDPALRSRFGAEVELPRPDQVAARRIFAVHLAAELPFAPQPARSDPREAVIDAGLSRLYDPNADNRIASLQFRDGKRREVAARELISGRLIAQICAAARAAAFERQCRGDGSGITSADMQAATAGAILRLRATLSVGNVRSYLADIPRDLDVVEVEPVRPPIEPYRYVRQLPEPAVSAAGGSDA